jgi:hypothetical protein
MIKEKEKEDDRKELDRLEKIFTKKLEVLEKREKDIESGKDRFAALYKTGHDLFSTESGSRFLELLEDFIKCPVSPAHQTERYACVREGQNEIIRMLLNMKYLEIKTEK